MYVTWNVKHVFYAVSCVAVAGALVIVYSYLVVLKVEASGSY